jgi:hypothetical protein
MRKSSQPRCNAAIAEIAALKTSKVLVADWNFQSGDFSRNVTGAPPLAVRLPRWHQVEQDMPGA